MRKSIALLALAVCVAAAPAFAQRHKRPSPEERAATAARAMAEQVKTAFNQKNAAALAALYTPDGLLIGIDGTMAHGPDEIERAEGDFITNLGTYTFDYELKEAHPIGNGVWAVLVSAITSNFSNGPTTRHTHVSEILVPVKGGKWKIRMTHASADIPLPPVQR
ncbi:MAG TPA: nuclear transport factor 2 family protein [Stellaceae bacterium]|nr:nuclear transport factor 2 family protein [Stellaceae bacterium]